MKYKFNKDYNIIIIKDDGIFDYYLQKNGYGNLFYMFGLTEKVHPSTLHESYLEHIEIAEDDEFWGC